MPKETQHHELAGDDLHNPKAHKASHETGGSDEINIAHAIGSATHTTSTLAELSAKVSDATLASVAQLNTAAGAASTMAALKAYDTTVPGGIVLKGFYADKDGGGGLFYYKSDEPRANHNGGTIIDPTHSVTPGDAGWWDDDNTGTGCWMRVWNGIYNAKLFGAKGDGAADDTLAIQGSIDAMPIGDPDYNEVTGHHWVLPAGTYQVSDAITFPNLRECLLDFVGVIEQTSASADGVVFDGSPSIKHIGLYNCRIIGIKVVAVPEWNGLAPLAERSGVKIAAYATRYSDIEVAKVYSFEKGLHLGAGFNHGTETGRGNCAWSVFRLGSIEYCKYGVYSKTHPDHEGATFTNANTFHGGDIKNRHFSDYPEHGPYVGFHFENQHVGNRFYNQALEKLDVGFEFFKSIGFIIQGTYFEAIDFLADLSKCWEGVFSSFRSPRKGQQWILPNIKTDASTRNMVYFNTGKWENQNLPVINVSDNGIGFESLRGNVDGDGEAINVKSRLWMTTYGEMRIDDDYGIDTRRSLSVCYQGTMPKNSGTFAQGSIVWNTGNPVNGQPIGWMCTERGTDGTLADFTGSININSDTMTVTDSSAAWATATGYVVGNRAQNGGIRYKCISSHTSGDEDDEPGEGDDWRDYWEKANDLKGRMYINIAGVTGFKVILRVTGNTIRLHANADATVTAAAISYDNPTWKALPNFA